MGAITGSKIAIIIFSKTYPESTRCLRELEKIIECHQTFGQMVLCVFYEIHPSDVRYQKMEACTHAAGITVWDVTEIRHDAELVHLIVTRVHCVQLNIPLD
ncbi:unnamed protein product [Sphenostylis stenocarpa]|uniref:TIR domain-containing protein n=1 Tax=Sphenostylis stenocarpa TaxID=92480 RepID=A0AA86SDL5_9FABA|nr:unnamed protein product [Sphenostylis stenocarpa]